MPSLHYSMVTNKLDHLYAHKHTDLDPFRFNQQVVPVFPDMIKRSVPGYSQVLELLGHIIVPSLLEPRRRHICYDLGCSLGAASFALASALHKTHSDITIHALDSSPNMMTELARLLATTPFDSIIKPQCVDICQFHFEPCSLVVLHYTLQFIRAEQKQKLMKDIYQALEPGGWLFMSEKIIPDDDFPELEQWHQSFKRDRGYSDLEIAQKRQALEHVMCPESIETHKQRLLSAGFSRVGCWHQALNFVALAACK